MNITNKHALITGGSSGIGKATAILLAKQGANISIIARTQATLDSAIRKSRPPAETKAISGTVKPWSAEAVAQSALKAMERGTFSVTQGMELNLIARLHSLVAPALNWYFDNAAAQAAKAK